MNTSNTETWYRFEIWNRGMEHHLSLPADSLAHAKRKIRQHYFRDPDRIIPQGSHTIETLEDV